MKESNEIKRESFKSYVKGYKAGRGSMIEDIVMALEDAELLDEEIEKVIRSFE